MPIVLTPVNDIGGLAISEGIEDALSIHQATGLGAWAAGCANRLPALARAVPRYVESVTILVDDDNDGRRFSRELAEALQKSRGRSLDIALDEGASLWRAAA
jgi:5S rRNA maturation endonuclease (ribonuclease M5)